MFQLHSTLIWKNIVKEGLGRFVWTEKCDLYFLTGCFACYSKIIILIHECFCFQHLDELLIQLTDIVEKHSDTSVRFWTLILSCCCCFLFVFCFLLAHDFTSMGHSGVDSYEEMVFLWCHNSILYYYDTKERVDKRKPLPYTAHVPFESPTIFKFTKTLTSD